MRLAPAGLLALALLALAGAADAQPGKKPARKPDPKAAKHPRLKQEKPPGQREKLSMGTLFLPQGLPKGDVPLLVHFHGAGWLAEAAAARSGRIAALHVSLGSGSARYEAPFKDRKRFAQLLAEAEKKAGRKFDRVALSGWSAGYGAVRMILRDKGHYQKVRWAILIDGMHTSYQKGKKVTPAHMDSFITFAKSAVAGEKQFLITHTKIVPGSYASTTETANYLLEQVGVKRAKFTGQGLFGLPQETEAKNGGLHVFGCAGAGAEDHVDHLHALPSLVALLDLTRR